VAGTQLGLALIVAVVGIGPTSVIEVMGHWFDVLRLIGAAIWSGWDGACSVPRAASSALKLKCAQLKCAQA